MKPSPEPNAIPSAELLSSYSLQDISTYTGLSERTLRFYMQKDLLPSPGRAGAGTRYPSETLYRALLICKLKEQDYTLSAIHDYLDTHDPAQLDQEGREFAQARGTRQEIIATLPIPAVTSVNQQALPEPVHNWERYKPEDSWFELDIRAGYPSAYQRRIHTALQQLSLPDALPAGQGIVILTADKTLHSYLQEVRSAFSMAGGEDFLGGMSVLHADAVLAEALIRTDSLSFGDETHLIKHTEITYPVWAVRGVIHQRRLHDNWFSRWHAEAATFHASIADWSALCEHIGLSNNQANQLQKAYLANALLLYGLYTRSRHYQLRFHEETRACLFDFCGDKTDIIVKLQTTELCDECQNRLEQLGIESAPVKRMLGVIRTLGQL